MKRKRASAILSTVVIAFLGAAAVAFLPAVTSAEGKGKRPAYVKATFAGGCFWCMEPPFEKLEGVVSVTSGYAGGKLRNPTYEQVSAGLTDHYESVQVLYDPARIGYEKLLDVFWVNIDPVDGGGQFCDRGKQYSTAIFFHDEEQRVLAERSRAAIERSGRLAKPIVTEIRPVNRFYAAEEYHQDFYKTNPDRYKSYRAGCGRDRRLNELWG